MSTMNIENAQTIDQLTKLTDLTDDSLLLGTKDGTTGQVSISELRKSFSGDNKKENIDNLYYSCKEIDRQLDAIRELITQNTQIPVDELNSRINSLQSDINSKFNSMNLEIAYIKNYLKI